MGKVTLHEARLHRQDLQIQKLMEDIDILNQSYQRWEMLLSDFTAERGQITDATVAEVIDYINRRGLVSDSVTTVTTRLQGWEEEL